MPRFWKLISLCLLLWLLTGVYVVGGHERAIVRRFGRAVTDSTGQIALRGNGLHYDWPWPFSQVSSLNFNEIRTLAIPLSQDGPAETQLLAETEPLDPIFLTGDKNLLSVRLMVQYRLQDSQAASFLFGSVAVEDRLSYLAESVLASVLAQSGVDYVQLTGMSALRALLTQQLQQQVDRQQLGLFIEAVTLDDVSPPVQVKADFLDVANARADREQLIQNALSAAEQRRQSAQAEAREIRDAAQSEAQTILQAAKGSASRFLQIVEGFRSPGSSQNARQVLARRLALEQYYHRNLAEILERVQGKVFLDTGQPIDVMLWQSRTSKPSVD